MVKKFLTIQEAAELADKSVQTIRRAIKSKKLQCKRQRTPQGFNYMVSKDSLAEFYGLKLDEESVVQEIKTEVRSRKEKIERYENEEQDDVKISAEDFRNFTKTLDRMVSQHSEERQNFMRLVNTLQEKIFVLENQMNLLKEPQKKWYQVWR